MKKLLLLTVAISSVMASHAMAPGISDEMTEQENQQAAAMVFTQIPVIIIAQTSLGSISRMQLSGITQYNLDNERITAGFNRTKQRFYVVRHIADCENCQCQRTENQVEAETLFNQYKTAFDATPRENRAAECPIQ